MTIGSVSHSSQKAQEPVYDSDSEDEEDYDFVSDYDTNGVKNHTKKKTPVIAHYRGLHFYEDYFNKEQRSSARRFHKLQNNGTLPRTGMYSSATHELAKQTLDFPFIKKDSKKFETIKKTIAAAEKALKKANKKILERIEVLQEEEDVTPVLQRGKNTSGKEEFETRFHEFIQRYVNSYSTFSQDLKAAPKKNLNDKRFSEQTKEKWTILKNLGFSKFPVVSTSEESKWSLDYATGFINWDKTEHKVRDVSVTPLTPKYDKHGRPKHPYLGIVYITLHLPNELDENNSARIVELFAEDKIRTLGGIGGHERSGYVRSRERAFVGGIDADHVKLARMIRVPNFSKDYQPYYQKKYGLSESQFKKFRSRVSQNTNMQATQRIIEHVISHQSSALTEAAEKIAKNNQWELNYVGKTEGTVQKTIPDLKTFTAKN